MADRAARKLHAIMFTPPYQGHINPLANLALKLASKGITVTFIHLEHVHHKIFQAHGDGDADFFSSARKSGLDVRYETMSDRFPLEFDRELNFAKYVEWMIEEFPALVEELVRKKKSEFCDWVNFLVHDTVQFWVSCIAEKYGFINVSLWTQPATVLSLMYHLDLLRENGHFPCKDDAEEDITYVPGISSMSTRCLMSFLKESEASGIVAFLLLKALEPAKKADFVLHNTVEELEPDVLEVLNQHQPHYAVGPINFFEKSIQNPVKKSLWSESDCAAWLSSKPPRSVLYVSFGSFVRLGVELIDEVAHGLLLSEANFIWVLRPGALIAENRFSFPEELEEKIKQKGLIIPWCDQIAVLSDTAVGGFLTHNGWNSTAESMWCGVPMICLPFECDQVTNGKLVVEDWGIGVNLRDGKSKPNRREIAEKIKICLSSEKLKRDADRVKKITQSAVRRGGSSERNFDRFIADLVQKSNF